MTRETQRNNFRELIKKIVGYGYNTEPYDAGHEGVKVYRGEMLIGYVYRPLDKYPVPYVRPNISRFCEESRELYKKRKELEKHYVAMCK